MHDNVPDSLSSGGHAWLLSLFDPIKIHGDERAMQEMGRRDFPVGNSAFLSTLDSNALSTFGFSFTGKDRLLKCFLKRNKILEA